MKNPLLAKLRQLLTQPTMQSAPKVVIAVVGGTVVLVGFAMVVLPGPAFLVIPLGLAILGTQFLWARRWLQRVKGLLPKGKRPAGPAPQSPSKSPR